jgi:hypothetical protein
MIIPKARATTAMCFKRKNILFVTAAAAFSSASQAWVITPSFQNSPRGVLVDSDGISPFSTARCDRFSNRHRNQATRVYFSSRKNNNEKKGLLSKVGGAVKSILPKILPKKWFGSDEEKQKIQRRKEVKNQVSGELNNILKDAPLGIRILGKLASPLMSSAASKLAETMAGQQRTTEVLLEDARSYLTGDPAVTRMIGEPISVGAPSSQSSSTVSINGKTQSRVELAMQVSGSKGSGVARLLATQEGIEQLQLEADGQVINVSLTTQPRSGGSHSLQGGDDNIIEAEIIDKKTK